MSFINNLNHLDLFILLVTIISMFYGYMRGLVKEILSILSIFLSGYFSAIFYPDISKFIKNYVNMDLIADGISFAILFVLFYSSTIVIINFITKFLNKTPLRIFDKNFGIIFGFFRSVLIFSLLNIFFNWIIWKKNVPSFINEAKSMMLINYTSKILLDTLPEKSISKIEETFNIRINLPLQEYFDEDSTKKYSEPAINKSMEKNKKGYTDSDNDSLNRLFNIENEE